MSDDLLTTVIESIMARSTAASGKAVFLDDVLLRQLLTPLLARCEVAEHDLAAERIENGHLREAFRTMERAANEREAERDKMREHHKNLQDELDGIYEREAGASL